jgi:hypothetical protein
MSSTDRSDRDPLDQALGSLPREVQPSPEVWNSIQAQLADSSPVTRHSSPFASMPWGRMAAGFLLIVASSVVTYVVTQQSAQERILQAQQSAAAQIQQAPAVAVSQVSFGGSDLGAEYLRTRKALDAEFRRQIALLPPVTRARLERNLADLRRASSEISATLAENPNNALLQELLLSSYQNELNLLRSVTTLAAPAMTQRPRETTL